MRYVAGRHMLACRIAVPLLIIEENVRTKSPKKRSFVSSSEEQSLINADAPGPERSDNTLVRRC